MKREINLTPEQVKAILLEAPPKLVPLPLQHVNSLREFIGTRKHGRIFEISESRVEQMTRFYAKRVRGN
jgi:hypothetical protein